ncbi:MAG: class I tRNA ligase family protein, partial [Rickettsiales bacterium]|nr:class I tRNA ligase family protein [Rickettsiales bacterium]
KRKLVVKFFNAARFIFGLGAATPPAASVSIDADWCNKLNAAVKASEKYFTENDYTGALIATEQAFWDFCDNYLEIAKGRAYAGDASALLTLQLSLETFCGLFAPFMPFITEEVWRAKYDFSIHTQKFPSFWPDFSQPAGDFANYDKLCELVSLVRGKKTGANKSIKAPIKKLTIADNEFLRNSEADIKNVLNAEEIVFSGMELLGELEWGE